MARILTGIQSSGRPHLGNLLGAIIPAIKLSQQTGNESFFFIADLHKKFIFQIIIKNNKFKTHKDSLKTFHHV